MNIGMNKRMNESPKYMSLSSKDVNKSRNHLISEQTNSVSVMPHTGDTVIRRQRNK